MVDFLVNVPGQPKPISWRVSTEVNVGKQNVDFLVLSSPTISFSKVPDVFPFAPCPQSECNNPPNGTLNGTAY
jgi:hypothetical protein